MKLCALAIGHKRSSPGAVNPTTGLSEFAFNEPVSLKVAEMLQHSPHVRVIRVYRREYRDLPGDINELRPDFVIEIHANASADHTASGSECLYYYASDAGAELAAVLQRHLLEELGLSNRGVHGIHVDDRGGYLLRHTKAPAVIAEPFFIDNDEDLKRTVRFDLVAGYARAIEEFARPL
jgi:N-acetylmuramoyl-L-alanine amidase